MNAELKQVFDEDQIYRIDHYLGKETVQNIFVFRFANLMFEPLWNSKYVDNVQVTVAETVGVEQRAGYFDNAGELRDMVQSHALQMLALVAMEPPNTLSANDIRDEKAKVLRAIKPVLSDNCEECVVRGQYGAGKMNDKDVPAYRDEPNVPKESVTDSFVALKLEIQNWRWAGVPFYVRAGKRMPERVTEVNITFKDVPRVLLANEKDDTAEPNVITIRVQPNEGISMRLGAKPPGQKTVVRPVDMNFTYGTSFGQRIHDAYERLIMDALIGDAALFTRDDEVEAEWSLITPILEHWANTKAPELPNYPAGSWGPEAAGQDGDRHRPQVVEPVDRPPAPNSGGARVRSRGGVPPPFLPPVTQTRKHLLCPQLPLKAWTHLKLRTAQSWSSLLKILATTFCTAAAASPAAPPAKCIS